MYRKTAPIASSGKGWTQSVPRARRDASKNVYHLGRCASFVTEAFETTHVRSPATPIARPITGAMHTVMSDFGRYTPAPQEHTTTRLSSAGGLLDAAGYHDRCVRAARCSWSSKGAA